MPDLIHTLQGNDLGFLRMVASIWGVELPQPDVYTALPALVSFILNKSLVHEMVEALPTEASTALETLYENQGRLPWHVFVRRFGDVRVMGAGRRDRERPDINPVSPAERLWYRGLVGKAFFNIPPEPQEYAYIPDDLLEIIQPSHHLIENTLSRPASPLECAVVNPVSDGILDDACSLLSAIRTGMPLPETETAQWPISVPILTSLLQAAGLLDKKNAPLAEAIRSFLEAPRPQALALLVKAWLSSSTFNDLHFLPGLKFEGNWQNDPILARQAILALIKELPDSNWWHIPGFISSVRSAHPDYQRPAGDYDSWFIFQESTQSYLRGFSSWDEVDGALIRFLIIGPLHWLGLLDLAAPTPETQAVAFRRSAWFDALITGSPSLHHKPEILAWQVKVDGHILISHASPRAIRYQVARFAQFENRTQKGYEYRLTPASLERARSQKLKASHFINLMRKYPTTTPIHPGVINALERWENLGVQTKLEKVFILRANAPELINLLKQNSRTSRYLGELLNPTTVLVKATGRQAILEALMEAGYLMEFDLD
jgi:hypothetical protein